MNFFHHRAQRDHKGFTKILLLNLCVFSVLSVCSVVSNVSSVSACECQPPTPEHNEAVIKGAEQIFEGRVVALETKEQPEENFDYTAPVPVSDSPVYAKAKLRVLTSYKGAAEGDKVEAYIDTLTSCGANVQIGDVGHFLLTRKDGMLVQAGLCDLPDEAGWETLKKQHDSD